MAKAYLEEFIPLNIAIVTISDTRTETSDTSGNYLKEALLQDNHNITRKIIIKDNVEDIANTITSLAHNNTIEIIITTGGTGFTARDNTKQAIYPLLDKVIDGFGEMFRYISYQEIGSSTLQSNAFAGFINNKIIFCIPGSTNACKTAYEKILTYQLNSTTKPCNFAALIKHKFI